MSACLSVPALSIARSAARITAIPPLSSTTPGPIALSPSRVNFWKGELRFEHRVDMRDQQHPLAAAIALMGSDEMPGALGFGQVEPLHFEAERLKFGTQHVAHRADPGEVQRAAILVHHPLEQSEHALRIGIDRRGDLPLGAAELGGGGQGGGERERAEQVAEHGPRLGSEPPRRNAATSVRVPP